MNKYRLVQAMARRTGMSHKQANIALDAVFDIIVEQLRAGDPVTLSGFGVFVPYRYPDSHGTSPVTGKRIKIKSFVTPRLKASRRLRW